MAEDATYPTVSEDPVTPAPTDTPGLVKPSDTPVAPTDEEYRKQQEYMLKERERITNAALAHMKAHNDALLPLQTAYIKELSARPPAPPAPTPAPLPPNERLGRQHMGNAALGYMAVALPLAMLLGRRGRNAGWYALGALGEGMSAVVKGQDARAARLMEQYKEAVRLHQEQSQEAYKHYAEIMANNRTTLQQKLAQIQTLSGVYQGQEMFDAARTDNTDKVIEILGKMQELVYKRHPEAAAKAGFAAGGMLFNTEAGKAFRAMVIEKEGFDPDPRVDDGTPGPERMKRSQELMTKYHFPTFVEQYNWRKKGLSKLAGQINPKTRKPYTEQEAERAAAAGGEGEGTDQSALEAEFDKFFGPKKNAG